MPHINTRALLITTLLLLGQIPGSPNIKLSLKRKALVVGANYGGKERAMLKYAQSDAKAFARVLSDLGGVDNKDIHLLMEPDKGRFLKAMEDIRNTIGKGRGNYRRFEFLLYYSGHADEKGLLLGNEQLTYKTFKNAIKAIPADIRIAVVDACAAGALTRMKGGKRRQAFLIDESSDMKGHAFLTSNTGDEAAQESDLIQGSYFTHVLVSGLRGAADITQDGKVTLNEAYQYAFHETLAKTEGTMAGPQHAGYDMQLSGTGEVVMTDLRSTAATLIMDENLDGRIFIRNSEGRLVVEVRKYKGRAVQLGLEPGQYKVVMEKEGPLFSKKLTIKEHGETYLDNSGFKPVILSRTVSRGGQVKTAPDSSRQARTLEEKLESKIARLEDKIKRAFRSPDSSLSQIPPEAEREPDVYDTIPVSLSLFPNIRKREGRLQMPKSFHYQSYNLLAGAYYKLDGIGLGILGQWAVEDVRGVQGSLILNYVGDTLKGVQASSVANVAKIVQGAQIAATVNLALSVEGWQGAGTGNLAFDVKGMQGAGGFNIANNIKGGQGAGGFNIARDVSVGQGAGVFNFAIDVKYVQGAGVFNIARDVHAVQGAGVFNIARDVKVVQGAGVFNIARDVMAVQGAGVINAARNVKYGQGAGVLNIAADVEGFQGAGFMNIAGKIKGVQVGVINLAGHVSGETIGILNLAGNGKIHPSIWMDEAGVINLSLKTGSRNIYGLINAGILGRSDGRDVFIARGMGIGVQWPIRRVEVFTDVSYNRYEKPEELFHYDSNLFIRQRLGLNLAFQSHFKITAGISWNLMRTFFEEQEYQDYLPVEDINVSDRFLWQLWPGFFTGFEF